MVTQVRTIDFLPDIFKTKSNEQLLAATLDQLVQQPDYKRIQGYIGSKFGYGVSNGDSYIVEPSKIRTDYQLEPSIVFTNTDTGVPNDAITYPGLLEALSTQGNASNKVNPLFKNEFYSWDSFCDLDKLINHTRYYWLPNGPDAVTISAEPYAASGTYGVVSGVNTYKFALNSALNNSENPTLTLVRGGRYTFMVDQKTNFWIQTMPGLSGVSPASASISVRDIYGVTNNGTSYGPIVFDVPESDAQNDFIYPTGMTVDIATTKAWDQIDGMSVYDLNDIDGVTDLENKTILFYGQTPFATGYIGNFYDSTPWGTESYEGGEYTNLNSWSYKVTLIRDNPARPVVKLVQQTVLPTDSTIEVKSGKTFATRKFVRNSLGEINLLPLITASLDTLYYQDSQNPDKVGVIKLVDASQLSIDINDILGAKTYESPNGITFTNGLKVQFNGNIIPASYLNQQFYVEGVGTSIQLLPITDFLVTEPFSVALQTPYDINPYDTISYGEAFYVPEKPDYIVINRASINKNAWSRGNRWFHEDVLKISIENNTFSPLSTAAYSDPAARAKRPIIEFYPNLKLFNTGSVAKQPVDYINFSATDAFIECNGQNSFTPDDSQEALFDGARIVFANDLNPDVKSKIYVASFIKLTGSTQPIISLTIAPDGECASSDQIQITKGDKVGHTYWFDGTTWIDGQFKQNVNQPPLFDIFDSNGISFGDQSFYAGSDFNGCTIFEYAPGTGADDTVLGFPIKYSSVNNLGDISFNLTLNTQTFNYVNGSTSMVGKVESGYVFDYKSRTDYTRMIGWQPAVEESFQYQVFEFTYNSNSVTQNNFKCDVAALTTSDTLWKPVVVYVDNARQEESAYTITTTSDTTTIQLASTDIVDGTPVTIMIYSNQVSKIGYYQLPSNLDHNPFNLSISTVNLGDIRGHYKSICNNIRTLVGSAFGSNNFRDLGNLVSYGTKLIQNSAPLAAAGIFYRNKEANIFNAIDYNANEYVKFKTLLADTVNKLNFYSLQDSSSILDEALIQIANIKTESSPFFWSDMVPAKDATITNSYTFTIGVNTTEFALSRVYDFDNANYYSVLIYRTRIVNGVPRSVQMVRGVDYTISSTENKVTMTSSSLQQGDLLVVKEYYQTYGSFVPNTPSKIGLYPSFRPEVVLDTTYINPTYFIKGHDGSYNKLYGEVVDGYLQDYRDRALFEFETRIYNNIKVNAKLPISYADIFPGQFRTTDYSVTEVNDTYNTYFLNWVGINRVNYKSQNYIPSNEFTWNYKNSKSKTGETIQQGNWRGIYLWYYDTATPNLTPWEMLGLSTKPSWWESRYGEAPYTSDNTLLWDDLSTGYVYNDNNGYYDEKYARPGLLNCIPVNSVGELLSPFENMIGIYNANSFKNNWEATDMGPTEYSYRKSSSWPFDLMKLFALYNPAKFFALGLNLDKYKYNDEFKQYLVNDRTRNLLTPSELKFYGSGSYINTTDLSQFSTNSYTNWVVDYLIQFGLNGSEFLRNLFLNLDVRLAYRMAGFSDKDMLKFFVERGSTDNTSNSLLIPDESYTVMLYENEPEEVIQYSSIIVQKIDNGYKVFGTSQTRAYFLANKPRKNGNLDTITVNNSSVKVYKDFTDDIEVIPYGTDFSSLTELASFMVGYGNYLTKQGMQFNDIENGLELSWQQMVAETLYWAQSGWEVGSTVNVNPCANQITIDRDNLIVQPLTLQQENYILNQNSLPINLRDLSVYRKETLFNVKALNASDSLSYLNAKLSSVEHIVIFDNVTSFNDLIYNTTTALRQQRFYVKGAKTAQWNGSMNAAGFIINANNIKEWKENQKYTKGVIVKYKTKYWMSLEIIPPTDTFDTSKWIVTDYDKIKTGLLPNASTRALESTIYYDSYRSNLQSDGDLLGYSLIGYRPRQYMTDADLDNVSQLNVYKNMISSKGTTAASLGLNNISLQQNTLSYELYENWAIKTTEYGGILNQNFVEFALDQSKLVGNPSIASLIIDSDVEGSEQQVPLYKLTNYGRQITNPNILPTVTSFEEKLPNAGYVNLNDVRAAGYQVSSLNDSIINDIYKGDYIWIADKLNTWNVYSMMSMSNTLTSVQNNLDNTATFVFAKPHNLVKDDSFGVLNFNSEVNGFHTVIEVTGITTLTVSLSLQSSTTVLSGTGLVCKMQYQRVGTARDIQLLPSIYNEYQPYLVWTDKNTNGDWTVYQRTVGYSNSNFARAVIPYTYGVSTAFVDGIGYFVTDTEAQKLYQYQKVGGNFVLYKQYEPAGSLASVNFGTVIAHNDKFLIVSAPNPDADSTDKSYMFVYKITRDSNLPILTLEQVEEIQDFDAGHAIALSGDGNFLYFDLKNYGLVVVYQQDNDFVYTDTTMTLSEATVVNETTFVVAGDKTTYIEEGKYVCFDNAGYETVYTVITSKWTPDSSAPTNHSLGYTTFYTIEPMQYSYASGSSVFTATYHFSAAQVYNTSGTLTTDILSGDENISTSIAMGYGHSLATNYDGTKLFVGAPYWQYDNNNDNVGKVFVYDRIVVNQEAQYNGIPGATYIVLTQFLCNPEAKVYLNGVLLEDSDYLIAVNRIGIRGELIKAGDIITISTAVFCNSVDLVSYESISAIMPGEEYGFSIACNTYASEVLVGSPNNFNADGSQGALFRHTDGGKRFGQKVAFIGTNLVDPIYFYINGYVVNAFRQIAFTSASVVMKNASSPSGASTTLTLNSTDLALIPEYGSMTFKDLATGTDRSIRYKIISGSIVLYNPQYWNPDEDALIDNPGFIIDGLSSKTFTLPNSVVDVPLGSANVVADAINRANITNVFAYVNDNSRLVISLRDKALNPVNNKLNVTTLDGDYLYQLGFAEYTKTQIITDPHSQKKSLFGYSVKFNQHNSFVVGAPMATRYMNTTFDFTSDGDYHNDTVFDNGFTDWEDGVSNAGAVYMFDYINTYEEELTEAGIGKYFYAQSVNDNAMTFGTAPMYGTSMSFDGYVVMVGNPDFYTESPALSGKVVIYENENNTQNWGVFREYTPVVDINKIQRVQLYNNIDNVDITSLDYFDPLEGKLLGAVRENIDFIAGYDPAGYNNPSIAKGNTKWGKGNVGSIWFDTSSVRFINYHQNDVAYDSRYWGAIFPGSTVSVYTWVESDVQPSLYAGSGTVYDTEKFSVVFDTDANSVVVPKYYYWVKNTNVLFSEKGKTLTDSIIQSYITNPQGSGISYFAPLSRNTFGLFNAAEFINNTNTSIHVGFSSTSTDVSKHEEYKLIRSNYPLDFLPGFPGKMFNRSNPEGLYDRFLDSLSGTDETGAVVPDPALPKLMQTGISVRPRQTMFLDRFKALENYLTYVNSVIAQYPIAEFGNASLLSANGEFYNTMSYWNFVYWWETGFSSSTRTSLEVAVYSDLQRLNPVEGLIVGVAKNGQGKREIYIYRSNTWERIGLQDGTIEFSSKLWDYTGNRIGYGDNYFDSVPFDEYPSIETRFILRAINEQIFVNDLVKYRNDGLILLFEYIQSENIDHNNYMPWLNKTSFVDMNYFVRELTQYDRYRNDSENVLDGYIDEIKPYHVVIKEFTMSYTGVDTYDAGYTDFDLPAKYSEALGKFITPRLVYEGADDIETFLPASSIWENTDYTSWFNNYGVQLSTSYDSSVCELVEYMTNADVTMRVDNAKGLPIQGEFKLGEETIGYSDIDRDNNILLGLSRGLNNSLPTAHFPGEVVVMDLPGVIVINSSRRYTSIPNVTAYIDTSIYPAPRVPATLKAILGDNRVISVDVVNPGSGYVVAPEIVFDFSYSVDFDDTSVNFAFNTLEITDSEFEEADLVKIQLTNTTAPVIAPGYYYLHLVSVTGTSSFYTLHKTHYDALNGRHSVNFYAENASQVSTYRIGLSALAISNLSGNKARTIIDTIRFDRTSYQSKVVEWVAGEFWSSPYNSENNDSSANTLMYASEPYTVEIDSSWVTPTGGTGAQLTVYNVLLGGNYYIEIGVDDSGGSNYNVGDVITIPGTVLSGTSPANDCVITVQHVGAGGDIIIEADNYDSDVTVTGSAVDAQLSSTNGAVLMIDSIQSNTANKTLVNLDFNAINMMPGQIKGLKAYFYSLTTPYTYDDSGANGAIIEIYKPRFNPDNISNQYTMKIVDPGSIYSDGDTIIVPGASLGGVTGKNDAIITIQYATVTGEIYISKIDGIAVKQFDIYYLNPIGDNTVQIFSDPGLTIPVNYPIIYSGVSNLDFCYVPEPIVPSVAYTSDTASLVTYDNKIWRCIESNNDLVFDITKWEEVSSDDRSINALDRIVAYYQPTYDMIGKDLALLVDGIIYPENVYMGNKFALAEQFPVDVELVDLPYSIRGLSIKGMIYDGNRYVGVADAASNSYVIISSNNGETWELNPISEQVLGVTSISFTDDRYVITTTNVNLPILISYDAQNWLTIGSYSAYDYTDFDIGGFDSGAIEAPAVSMYGSTIANGKSYTVGTAMISSSFDYSIWSSVFTPSTRLVNVYHDVKYIDMVHYVGYIAVGRGDVIVAGEGTAAPDIQSYSKIITSVDGLTWTEQTPNLTDGILYAIDAGNNTIVVVGENANIWYSGNGNNWTQATISGTAITTTLRSVAIGSGIIIAVGDNGTILKSTDGMTYTQITSASITTHNLNHVLFDGAYFIVTGDNDTVLRSANGVLWASISYKEAKTSDYVVTGSDFNFGYGPEELVAGVVTDNLNMKVTTSPGAYWDTEIDVLGSQDFWYYHTGFNMVARTVNPDSNLRVSFDDYLRNPATIAVYIIDNDTSLNTRIYEISTTNNTTSYTIDWTTRTLELNEALASNESLLVEVYSIGNGRELVKGNTTDYPLRVDSTTGNSMILFNLAYQAIVNDPVVYLNGTKLEYLVDYQVTFDEFNNLKMVFDTLYDDEVDYISFAILGSSSTQFTSNEYGYSVPDTEVFVGNGYTYVTTLDLSYDNPDNLVVEFNGKRLLPYPIAGYDYTVDANTNTITLTEVPTEPTSDDIVSITAFNDTRRQWVSTNSTTTLMTSEITYIYNTAPVKFTVDFANALFKFVDSELVRIDGVIGAVGVNGNTYYVKDVTDYIPSEPTYTYELYKDSSLNEPVTGWDIGAYEGGGYVWRDAATFTTVSPTVPNTMPDIEYTEGWRTWVYVNGSRVDPSKLIYRADNKLSICAPISSGQMVLGTAFVDGYTPEEETFSLIVNKNNVATIYRENVTDGTWLTQDVTPSSTTLYVKDVARLVQTDVQSVIVANNGTNNFVYVAADINAITNFTVFDDSGADITTDCELALIDGRTALIVTNNVSVGQTVTVTVYLGNTLIIGTEQIYFDSLDLATNSVTGIIRGVNGTASTNHSVYTAVFGINDSVKLDPAAYYLSWNSTDLTTRGDPIQISTTATAIFLRK